MGTRIMTWELRPRQWDVFQRTIEKLKCEHCKYQKDCKLELEEQSSTVSIKTKLKPNRPSCKTVHNLKRIVVVKPSCFNHSTRTVHQRIFLTISSTLLKREKLEPYMCP